MAQRILQGDLVKIIAGDDKGKTAKATKLALLAKTATKRLLLQKQRKGLNND